MRQHDQHNTERGKIMKAYLKDAKQFDGLRKVITCRAYA